MNEAIYDAFAMQVDAFCNAFSPPLPAAYPNVPFTPPTEGGWLEVRWFPNETQNYGIAFDGPSMLRGFGQISICSRPGAGISTGLALADSVIAAFGKGTRFDRVLVYRKPWASSVVQDNERLMIPITILWQGGDA